MAKLTEWYSHDGSLENNRLKRAHPPSVVWSSCLSSATLEQCWKSTLQRGSVEVLAPGLPDLDPVLLLCWVNFWNQ